MKLKKLPKEMIANWKSFVIARLEAGSIPSLTNSSTSNVIQMGKVKFMVEVSVKELNTNNSEKTEEDV